MKLIPKHCGAKAWDMVLGPAWAGLVSFSLTSPGLLTEFRKKTGHNLTELIKRGHIDRQIDEAEGEEAEMWAAWGDFVTWELWGVDGAEEATPC
jgi:hypothetical protein